MATCCVWVVDTSTEMKDTCAHVLGWHEQAAVQAWVLLHVCAGSPLHPHTSFFRLLAHMEVAKHPSAFGLTSDFGRSWSSGLNLVDVSIT